MPTVCSETCVGRIRYLGVILYDADRIEAAASVEDEGKLYQSQLEIFLDPNDRQGDRAGARRRRAGGLARSREEIAGLENGDGLEDRLPAPSRISHAADGLVRAAAVADPGGRRSRQDGHGRRHARCEAACAFR